MRVCHYCKQEISDDTLTVCPCGAGLPEVPPATDPVTDPAPDPAAASMRELGDCITVGTLREALSMVPDEFLVVVKAPFEGDVAWIYPKHVEIDGEKQLVGLA